MQFPFKRKPKPYLAERDRLLEVMSVTPPTSDEYQKLSHRLNEIDRLINRASETKKAWIPALGTVLGVGGIYALQQFGGVIIPKALETIAARQEQKKSKEDD